MKKRLKIDVISEIYEVLDSMNTDDFQLLDIYSDFIIKNNLEKKFLQYIKKVKAKKDKEK